MILASRSEVKRGEWKQFESGDFRFVPWVRSPTNWVWCLRGWPTLLFTLTPKNEWDVAAGAALVASAGGFVATLDNAPLRCNRKNPLLSGLLARARFCARNCWRRCRDICPCPAPAPIRN